MTMLETIIREFPVSDVAIKKSMPTSRSTYTKEEVDNLIAEALAEAKRIDEESMRKHNRDATVISMILGFTALALFVDGLLRLLGIIPPFMGIDIDLLDQIVERVETDIIDKVRQVPIQRLFPK
ncbi:gp7 [Prochlorococcus phage P-HM2]|uniref:Gp7 n=1 Tax=Prochlorococcus phage P-HM2 TaxID=445696 RepID=E3ST65_9CAUD|nr:gp7 [Prochlorococcus phage P-HM2]ADO99993.1 gp7 [Prochlorococcus phage P-HM2]